MRLGRRALAWLTLVALSHAPIVSADTHTLSFAGIPGWAEDDHRAALAAFIASCPTVSDPAWQAACAAAPDETDARGFFERYFRPSLVGNGKPTLFTGYYEPEFVASPVPTARFAFPIYRTPPELRPGAVWFDRATIESEGLLRGRGLELAWLADPVDVFFLQVQGSGRLLMPDGHVLRVGFAAKNGQPYRSVGMELVRRGLYQPSQVSAHTIRTWVDSNPEAGRQLLWTNPSFIFFQRVDVPAALGPLGALHLPVTPGRSLAVDPAVVPLGAPVWVETSGNPPLHRLMVAQDIGTAIKGPGRADVFIGSGFRAGEIAGRMHDDGRMIVLLPTDVQEASLPREPN